jgi:hypothetical protein
MCDPVIVACTQMSGAVGKALVAQAPGRQSGIQAPKRPEVDLRVAGDCVLGNSRAEPLRREWYGGRSRGFIPGRHLFLSPRFRIRALPCEASLSLRKESAQRPSVQPVAVTGPPAGPDPRAQRGSGGHRIVAESTCGLVDRRAGPCEILDDTFLEYASRCANFSSRPAKGKKPCAVGNAPRRHLVRLGGKRCGSGQSLELE